jgi:hypothetical protein
MKSLREWRDTVENNLAATVASPRDVAYASQQTGGRERLVGLPKENRPPHLLYGHSDRDVGAVQKEIVELQQRVKDVFDKIKQTETYVRPDFRAKAAMVARHMTTAVDSLNHASMLLTFDPAGARKAVQDDEDDTLRRATGRSATSGSNSRTSY